MCTYKYMAMTTYVYAWGIDRKPLQVNYEFKAYMGEYETLARSWINMKTLTPLLLRSPFVYIEDRHLSFQDCPQMNTSTCSGGQHIIELKLACEQM